MIARWSIKFALLLLAVLLSAASAGLWAADDKADPEPPRDDSVTPAIDPAKLVGNAVLNARDAANRTTSSNNLKLIMLAVHSYHDAYRELPADVLDKAGKPILSWRVKLLPFLEQNNLYMKFKLDEPWDSKNNRPLSEILVKVYMSPRVKVKGTGYTVYQTFFGPGAVFDKGKGKVRFAAITDGLSNTLFAVETSKAVPWTKPADIPFDKDKKVSMDFGKAYDNKPLGALLDGSVRYLDLKKIKPETLKNAIMPNDGNVLGADWNE
jgi:hypothetical protein